MILRLLPFHVASGYRNMATDETLLLSAHAGQASLRFYGWSHATVTLGYFQSARLDPQLASLPWVRRATGGATLVHHHELTYALALPPGTPWQSGVNWMPRMHAIIQAALTSLGVPGIVPVEHQPVRRGEFLCFQQQTPGDLTADGNKVVGSAQRKHRRALLQHGSILLRRSELTPMLPGIFEVTGCAVDADALQGRIAAAFEDATGWRLAPGDWTMAEHHQIAQLVNEKYATAAWNTKR